MIGSLEDKLGGDLGRLAESMSTVHVPYVLFQPMILVAVNAPIDTKIQLMHDENIGIIGISSASVIEIQTSFISHSQFSKQSH